MTNLDFALQYAAKGWPVIPLHFVLKNGQCSCKNKDCNRVGKHPVGHLTKKGISEAATDEYTIRQWWQSSPYWNIGFATGANGHFVIDVDVAAGKVGQDSLDRLIAANGQLPDTLLAKTGSGGFHYHFRSPKPIKNSQSVFGKDLDVRGKGGYVVLPPSNHATGSKYEWLTDSAVAEAPEWIVNLLVKSEPDLDELQPEVVAEAKAAKLSPEQIVKLLDFIPADCDRETWWKVGAALKVELGDDRGFKAWREWSLKFDPEDPKKGWNEVTAFSQWNSFEPRGITAGTIVKLAKENGFRGFNREAADLPEVKDDWVYAIGVKRFVETKRMIQLDKEQYDAKFAPLFDKGNASMHVLRNEGFRRVDDLTYWPNKPQIVDEEGKTKLNTWTKADIDPVAGDVSILLEHVAYLYPDPVEADILLDYLAFQVQCPGEKVHWAVLMQGQQGTGKSYFGELLKAILGEQNIRSVTNEMLHETYTGWIQGKQFIVVEEMMAGRRLELMNKLKPMITEKWLSIREMYKPPFEQINRCNFLFLTNHSDSIIIDDTDRRYCVLNSNTPPNPDPRYYRRLFEWTKANPGVILGYLLSRDLAKFEPKSHAPMTAGKRALVRESMNPLTQSIADDVSLGRYPFDADLVGPGELPEILLKTGVKTSPKELKRVFATLRFRPLDIDGHLWAVRNFDQYSDMTKDEVSAFIRARAKGDLYESPGAADYPIGGANVAKTRKPI
jgi:hypothetical protein